MKQSTMFDYAKTTKKTLPNQKRKILEQPLEEKLGKKIKKNDEVLKEKIEIKINLPEDKQEVEQIMKEPKEKKSKKINKQKAKTILMKYQDEIEKIKSTQPQNSPKNTQINIDPISIRQKYQELLSEQPTHILPAKYKDLYDFFVNLDDVLEYFTRRDRTTYFDDIKDNFEKYCQRKFSLEQIQRIQYISKNEFFQLKYQKRIKTQQLHISALLTVHKDLEDRKVTFKKFLLEHTINLHEQFLKSIKEESFIKNQNFSEKCLWHPQFKVHNVPDIPLEPLPEKIQIQDKQNYTYKPSNQLCTSLFEDRDKKKNDAIAKLKEEAKNIKIENNNTGIDDKILAMIRVKEERQKKLDEELKNQEILPFTKNLDLIMKVFELIKLYFVSKNTQNAFITQIVDQVKIGLKAISLNMIKEAIEQMVSLLDFCFKIVVFPAGNILQLQKGELINAQTELNRLNQQNKQFLQQK